MTDPSAIPEAFVGAGKRLRMAREAAGMSQSDVAERLKMPLRVVQSLEADDWSRLGAPVYVRGQLRSYARLVGLLTEPVLKASGVPPVQPAELQPRTYTPPMRRFAESASRRLIYIVITIAIVLPVWVQMQRQAVQSGASSQTVPLEPAPLGHDLPSSTHQPPSPLVASITPVPTRAPAQAATADGLRLRLSSDSWVEITASDGKVLASELMPAGTDRAFALQQGGRVVIGNAAAATVERAGQRVNLDRYLRANVARFTVSSDGSVAAATQ